MLPCAQGWWHVLTCRFSRKQIPVCRRHTAAAGWAWRWPSPSWSSWAAKSGSRAKKVLVHIQHWHSHTYIMHLFYTDTHTHTHARLLAHAQKKKILTIRPRRRLDLSLHHRVKHAHCATAPGQSRYAGGAASKARHWSAALVRWQNRSCACKGMGCVLWLCVCYLNVWVRLYMCLVFFSSVNGYTRENMRKLIIPVLCMHVCGLYVCACACMRTCILSPDCVWRNQWASVAPHRMHSCQRCIAEILFQQLDTAYVMEQCVLLRAFSNN